MLLNSEEIAKHVKGGQIFRKDLLQEEWQKQLRGAAYDLRIDSTVYVKRQGRTMHTKRTRKFLLQPGEIAVMRSAERLCLDWTIAANLVSKFSAVRDGLHVLHGGLIDPGFGKRWNEAKKIWADADDERIIFLVTNVSDRALPIDPGTQTILAIQFFKVAELKEKPTGSGAENRRAEEYWKDVVNEEVEHLGLQFFQDSRVWERRLDELYGRMSEVVLLVLFVLGVAALGAVAAVLIALMENAELRDAAEAPSKTMIGIGLALTGGLYLAIAIALRAWLPRTVSRIGRKLKR